MLDARHVLPVLVWCAADAGACAEGADPPPVAGVDCPGPCDDRDECTDDLCDPATRRCVFVPADAAHACRTDQHCDDGVACTVDRCVVWEACGLQRCAHEEKPECVRCFKASECADDDGCTIESCVAGFCMQTPDALCEPRCSVDWVGPLAADEVHASGTFVGRPACVTCPCATGVGLAGGDAGSLALAFEPQVDCAIRDCAAPSIYACGAFAPDLLYTVWGTLRDEVVAVEGWCLAEEPWRRGLALEGHLVVGGARVAALRLEPGEHGMLHVRPLGCAECLGEGGVMKILELYATGDVLGGAVFLGLTVVFEGAPRTVDVRLYFAPFGMRGRFTSSDSGTPLAGEVRLELVLPDAP